MEGDLKRNETVSPMAGKTPSQEMPVDVTRLEREYFERLPDKPEQKARLEKLSPEAVVTPTLAGEPIRDKLTRAPGHGAPIGGLRVVTENGWLAARPSGTENIYKIYAESFKDQQHLGAIVNEAQRIAKDALESVDSSCPGGRRVDER